MPTGLLEKSHSTLRTHFDSAQTPMVSQLRAHSTVPRVKGKVSKAIDKQNRVIIRLQTQGMHDGSAAKDLLS